jgi:hypothetical protein
VALSVIALLVGVVALGGADWAERLAARVDQWVSGERAAPPAGSRSGGLER